MGTGAVAIGTGVAMGTAYGGGAYALGACMLKFTVVAPAPPDGENMRLIRITTE